MYATFSQSTSNLSSPCFAFLAAEGYQQLLRVLQLVEGERMKQSSLSERLQENLSRAQEEISSLQSSMAQRTSHYQNLHTELMNKVSQATDTEKEVMSFLIYSLILSSLFKISDMFW